jgi:hypothetical protein
MTEGTPGSGRWARGTTGRRTRRPPWLDGHRGIGPQGTGCLDAVGQRPGQLPEHSGQQASGKNNEHDPRGAEEACAEDQDTDPTVHRFHPIRSTEFDVCATVSSSSSGPGYDAPKTIERLRQGTAEDS